MTLHPEVQKRAQREIDDVVGADRLPTSTDRERLPYCEAIVKEVFRWHPVVPLGRWPPVLGIIDLCTDFYVRHTACSS